MRNHQSKEDPMVVYAVSAGYKWFFAYPEQKVETVNTLTIPKNRPVVFKLQAMDTMTSFWIPPIGWSKICHDWHDNELDFTSR